MLAFRNPRGTNFVCATRDHLLQALSINKINSAAPCKQAKAWSGKQGPDRMLAQGGMSKGRLRRFFPSAEVFGTFCVKKYSKNDNKKNKRQQIKGKTNQEITVLFS